MRSLEDIILPPPFTLVRLREWGDAFSHAVATAPGQGAGTLIYVGRFDLAEFALILEPEEPLRFAWRAFYAGMTALSEAIIAQAQPETSVTIEWPDIIKVNDGLVGGGRLAWPPNIGENDVPPWLVFGGMIRAASTGGTEPGLNPRVTALEDEGFTGVLSNQLVESFARFFMLAVDAWQQDGFSTVVQRYLERLPRQSGLRREINETGDLLTHIIGKPLNERKRLEPYLAQPSWLDPATKGPRL